jgi:hypothetical protein
MFDASKMTIAEVMQKAQEHMIALRQEIEETEVKCNDISDRCMELDDMENRDDGELQRMDIRRWVMNGKLDDLNDQLADTHRVVEIFSKVVYNTSNIQDVIDAIRSV